MLNFSNDASQFDARATAARHAAMCAQTSGEVAWMHALEWTHAAVRAQAPGEVAGY